MTKNNNEKRKARTAEQNKKTIAAQAEKLNAKNENNNIINGVCRCIGRLLTLYGVDSMKNNDKFNELLNALISVCISSKLKRLESDLKRSSLNKAINTLLTAYGVKWIDDKQRDNVVGLITATFDHHVDSGLFNLLLSVGMSSTMTVDRLNRYIDKAVENTQTSYTPILRTLKTDLFTALGVDVDRFTVASEQIDTHYIKTYDHNGKPVVKYKGVGRDGVREHMNAVSDIMKWYADSSTDNKALDLVQDCKLLLWKRIKAINKYSIDCLLTPYVKVKPSSMTDKHGQELPQYLWKYTGTNIINELMGTVRTYIENQKAVRDLLKSYDSIETTVYNPLTEEEETVIKYHVVKSTETMTDYTDFNGKTVATVVDSESVNLFEQVPQICGLNATETRIYNDVYYHQTMTLSTLAVKLNVNETYLRNTATSMKKKIAKSGIFSGYIESDCISNSRKSKAVNAYYNGELLGIYDSVSKAADFFGIKQADISKVLNGYTKTTHGMTFEYADKTE